MQNLPDLDVLSYVELNQLLIDSFGARESKHLNKLWAFKCGNLTLEAYITKFC